MEIKNKIQSIDKINELGLNKFPEQLFKSDEIDRIKRFIREFPAPYYALRDRSKPKGLFKLKVKKEDILKEIKDYKLFTINVSSANYVDNQLLVGEIEFLSNGEIYATLSTNPTYSVRDAVNTPDFNIKTDIFSKSLNDIPYFDIIYKYISDHNLYDVIVEFALFDIPLGINNENIIIYELRTNY